MEKLSKKGNRVHDLLSEADNNLNKDFIRQLRKTSTRKLELSGMVDGEFYHTVFRDGGMYCEPFVLFEDRTFKEVKFDPDIVCHYVEIDGERCNFMNGKLPSQKMLINAVDNNGIAMFLDGESPEKEELFNDIQATLSMYYNFLDSNELKLCTCYIIHSYLLNIVGRTIYLLLDGRKGTGKTTLQSLMSKLLYHGSFCSKVTMAALCRKTHQFQSSVGIDEFDKYSDSEQLNLLGILNSGFTKGGVYELVSDKDKSKVDYYQTFSTKNFSINKDTLDATLKNRCLTIHTIGAKKKTKDLYGVDDNRDAWFQMLTNRIFCYCLLNGRAILDDINRINDVLSDGARTRRADIISIIAGIESHFTGKNELQEYIIKIDEVRESVVKPRDTERLFYVLEYLLDLFVKDSNVPSVKVENRDLVGRINMKLVVENPGGYSATASSVGKLIINNNIISGTDSDEYDRIGGNGRARYVIKRERLFDVVERCGDQYLKRIVSDIREKTSQPSVQKNLL